MRYCIDKRVGFFGEALGRFQRTHLDQGSCCVGKAFDDELKHHVKRHVSQRRNRLYLGIFFLSICLGAADVGSSGLS